ncbi:hypothetical protein ACGFK1_03025 [Mycobacterium sp. NPDC048908]|uniref:hypothetical protein n=1 Tax=Mycobacterium sp. NPDC048908 TaxID=3364292 RepID=UPI0037157A6D
MNTRLLQKFSYDPFDPAVMADPLPYYRVLRDEHPVYYIDKWDTYALSRFSAIWQVLEVNDGTFVASEGTLPAAAVLERRNDGAAPDPPLHPMPFHANFDTPIYDNVRRCTSAPFRPQSVSALADRIRELANQRLDELLPRGAFDLTQEYGGIVAASVVCELLGLPGDLAPDVLATVNAGSLAQPGTGVEVANARPGYLEYIQPVLPDLVEQERFCGTVMHTARWDHNVDLHDARVAVLGTGSTAAQLVPEVAKVAKRVYSVQRSPTWILPKPDRAYTGREKWIFAHVPFAKKVYRTRLWLRSESNIAVIENGSAKTQEFKGVALRALEAAVRDEQLRRKLTPDHPFGCKRLVFATDYLQALTQPHVEVVSSPARTLRARSLVTEDGTELDVDVVVCATGYAAADYLGQIDVTGEQGVTLQETWSDGAYAYLGMTVPGFPNFFMLYGPNTNVGSNSVILMLEAQARYIVRSLKHMRRRGKPYIAVRRAVMADFTAKIDGWMADTVWLTRCSNYFRAPNGRVVTQWPRSASAFWRMARRFKAADYVFTPGTASEAGEQVNAAWSRSG